MILNINVLNISFFNEQSLTEEVKTFPISSDEEESSHEHKTFLLFLHYYKYNFSLFIAQMNVILL